jgi:hypothetical protein
LQQFTSLISLTIENTNRTGDHEQTIFEVLHNCPNTLLYFDYTSHVFLENAPLILQDLLDAQQGQHHNKEETI